MDAPRTIPISPLPTTLMIGALLLPALFLPLLSGPWDCIADGSRFDPVHASQLGNRFVERIHHVTERILGSNPLPWRVLTLCIAAGCMLLLGNTLHRRGMTPQATLLTLATALWNPLTVGEWLWAMGPTMIGLPFALVALALKDRWRMMAIFSFAIACICHPAYLGLILGIHRLTLGGIGLIIGGLAMGAMMPIAFGIALTLADALDRFVRQPTTFPRRLAWVGLGAILAVGVIGTVGQMDRLMARAKLYDEVVQWCVREALPGESIGVSATADASMSPTEMELDQLMAHLRRIGRGDLRPALYDESSQADQPRYRVMVGEPGESELAWSLVQPLRIRYWAGSRSEAGTIVERNDTAAAQSAWLRAELERALATPGTFSEK